MRKTIDGIRSLKSCFGSFLKLSVSGASHAPEMSFRLENFPCGVRIDAEALRAFMERRAPGRDRYSTARREDDAVEFRSGLSDGVTTGGPIEGAIANRDMRPGDYGAERTVPRPGHADFGQWVETGRIPTGGGRNSGRLTAPLCAAGGICKQWLAARGIDVVAEPGPIGGKSDGKGMLDAIERARKAGDSVGGIVNCTVVRPPVGLGGPLFDGLESELSAALFAIPGVRGVAFGSAGDCCTVRGSKFNDAFSVDRGEVVTATNRHGGILGGRTTGLPIAFSVVFKPTPTVFREQDSVDLATMTPAKLRMKGRHDPCIARRAVPVVEAVTAFVLADALCASEAAHPRICLTLTGKTLGEDLAQYRSQRYFTDMVELRVDLLAARERTRAAEFPEMLRTCGHTPRPVPVVFTFRRTGDGGAFAGSESVRERFFRALLSRAPRLAPSPPLYVDFEDDFHVPALEKLAREKGVRIVRSCHNFRGKTGLTPFLAKVGMDEIAKLAFMPRNLADVSRLFAGGRGASHPPRILIAMGPLGLASRVLAARLGAPWTYASVGGLGELGHVSPQTLVRDYRFRSTTRGAALYGVTGWPLRATRSPELHGAMFAAADRDALMIPVPARTAREAIAFMKAMGMRGLAVTIPHKQAVMPLLDRVDEAARRVGAVNTVVVEGKRLVGYNTDVAGFSEAIRAFMDAAPPRRLRGLRAAVLGAGGASKAVVFALKRLGAKVEVFHRRPLTDGFDLVVNATPVDPIPEYRFTGRELVYDLVYVPAETPLMARARAAGCRCENGFSMLVAQAREQQRLFRAHAGGGPG